MYSSQVAAGEGVGDDLLLPPAAAGEGDGVPGAGEVPGAGTAADSEDASTQPAGICWVVVVVLGLGLGPGAGLGAGLGTGLGTGLGAGLGTGLGVGAT